MSLLIASDSGVVIGISFNDLKLFTIGFCSGKNDNVFLSKLSVFSQIAKVAKTN